METGTTNHQSGNWHLNALGKLSLLSIGVSNYSHSSFSSLKTCENDAAAIKEVISKTSELNADTDNLFKITSSCQTHPSRGEMIKSITRLSENAEDRDRIMFFFSGHGHIIDETYYLVPQDVYSENDPSAFIEFDMIVRILNRSLAKQKILLIDACFSGPDLTSTKGVKVNKKKKFYFEYLKKSKGLVVIASSTREQTSTTKSPNENLSLFTYYLTEALCGRDIDALEENKLLTVDSLYQYLSLKVGKRSKSYQTLQSPSIQKKSTGTLVLGDFSSRHSNNPVQEVATLQVTQHLSTYQKLVLQSMQKWEEFDLLPDAETILTLDEIGMDDDHTPTQLAFIYSTFFAKIKDFEKIGADRDDLYICFDHLFYPLKLYANMPSAILSSIMPIKVSFLESGWATCNITYPKYIVSRLSVSKEGNQYDALYSLVRDSDGEGIETLILKDAVFTTLIHHIEVGARVEAITAFDLLEKCKRA